MRFEAKRGALIFDVLLWQGYSSSGTQTIEGARGQFAGEPAPTEIVFERVVEEIPLVSFEWRPGKRLDSPTRSWELIVKIAMLPKTVFGHRETTDTVRRADGVVLALGDSLQAEQARDELLEHWGDERARLTDTTPVALLLGDDKLEATLGPAFYPRACGRFVGAPLIPFPGGCRAAVEAILEQLLGRLAVEAVPITAPRAMLAERAPQRIALREGWRSRWPPSVQCEPPRVVFRVQGPWFQPHRLVTYLVAMAGAFGLVVPFVVSAERFPGRGLAVAAGVVVLVVFVLLEWWGTLARYRTTFDIERRTVSVRDMFSDTLVFEHPFDPGKVRVSSSQAPGGPKMPLLVYADEPIDDVPAGIVAPHLIVLLQHQRAGDLATELREALS